ncbi:sensor histidine kinase [soil metagenome]
MSRREGSRTPLGQRLSVQGWFYLVVAVMVALVMLGTVVAAGLLLKTNSAADRLIQNIEPAQVAAYQLQASLVDQETGVRGYALTGEAQFLDPYRAGLSQELESAATIRALLPDDEHVQHTMTALQDAAEAWREGFAEPIIDSVVPGRPGSVGTEIVADSKASFDLIRDVFDTQNSALAALVERERADLDSARTYRDWLLTAMVIAFLAATAPLLMLVRMMVLRPLSGLKASAQQIADGDFDHPIDGTGPADLQELASAVESMRRRITEELSASQAAKEVLAEQAADLDAQAIDLRRSNAELEQFAYVASHDLQEPLRKVASFCQLLEKRYGDQLDERGTQYIEFAVDGAKRMQVLINDLLAFSRVGRFSDSEGTVALDEVIDRTLVSLGTAIDESGAVIERPAHLPQVRGDSTLMGMLWQNLIGNAIKFRAEGRPPVVEITCVEDIHDGSPVWLFSVADNGIGIPSEFAEKVFVIFQRLHSREAYGGTGIGLAVCQKIVNHYGGDIWLDPARAQGARICFTLPIQDTVTEGPSQ